MDLAFILLMRLNWVKK